MQDGDIRPFFSDDKNLEVLNKASRHLGRPELGGDSPGVTNALATILKMISANPTHFDKYSSSNIEWIGARFISRLDDLPNLPPPKDKDSVPSIFGLAYRFLCEVDFSQPGLPSPALREVLSFADTNFESFGLDLKQDIAYARYSMPIQLLKSYINDPGIVEFSNFSKKISRAAELTKAWEDRLSQCEEDLAGAEARIKNATATYNFVGLVDGFRALKTAKESERRLALVFSILLAVLMFVPPGFQIWHIQMHMDEIEKLKGTFVYLAPAFIATEVILVYLFRIVLSHFKSIKTQILQIDLRIALCQFVQSYADYAIKVKKDDSGTLSKFESVVFSNLVSEADGIPSTFDGTDQLASLIKSIRGS